MESPLTLLGGSSTLPINVRVKDNSSGFLYLGCKFNSVLIFWVIITHKKN